MAVSSDSVAGITNAAPAPCTARPAITTLGRAGEAADHGPDAEHHEADEQRLLAPEAVAERAGGEQQPGEHEGVGVDDPLQAGGAGAEVAPAGVGRATFSDDTAITTITSDRHSTPSRNHLRR